MLLCKEKEVELTQEFKNQDVIIQAYNTYLCSAYQGNYMIIIKDSDKDSDLMYSYFTDSTDLFYYYDMLISNF